MSLYEFIFIRDNLEILNELGKKGLAFERLKDDLVIFND